MWTPQKWGLDSHMRIPFEISEVDDHHEAAGYVYLAEDFLVFEFHVRKWGLFKGETATVKVERGVIDGISVQRRLFRDRLLVATSSLDLLREIPGPHVSEIELRTKRRYLPRGPGAGTTRRPPAGRPPARR